MAFYKKIKLRKKMFYNFGPILASDAFSWVKNKKKRKNAIANLSWKIGREKEPLGE